MTEAKSKPATWRDFERTNEGVKRADMLKVNIDQIRVKPGFNPRDINKAETKAKIEGMKNAYVQGLYMPPIAVSLASNDYVEIVDGHCRFKAVELANEELKASGGEEILALTCIPFKGNDSDRLIHTVLGNEGEKLVPIEVADVVKRLSNMGWDTDKIAKTFSYSVGWVNKLKFMAGLPEEVKTMVKNDIVSADVAVAVVQEHGEDAAVPKLNELVEEVKKQVAENPVKADGKPREVPKVTAKVLRKEKEKVDASAEPAPPKKKKEDGPKSLDLETFLEVRQMALSLPDDLPEDGFFQPDALFDVKLPGKIVSQLIGLKNMFKGEKQ